MIRTIALVFLNEFRLLAKDRVSIFMLILAPIVIIAVAGFSLGDIYGARPAPHSWLIPIVDQDRGEIAHAIVDSLKREPSVAIRQVNSFDEARKIVIANSRSPLAIAIPPGTSDDVKVGRAAHLIVYADPIKRLEATAIEVRIGEMCGQITASAHQRARIQMASRSAELKANLDRLIARLNDVQSQARRYRARAERERAQTETQIESQMRRAAADIEDQTRDAVERAAAQQKAAIQSELDSRRDAMAAVRNYLTQLQSSEHDFDRWLTALKAAAGSHASAIPPPPKWPAPPDSHQLAPLEKPIELPALKLDVQKPDTPKLAIKLPKMPPLADSEHIVDEAKLAVPRGSLALAGDLGWTERDISGGESRVNTFDQYVPGFGITFLLMGMLLGLSLGLIDERDWGTLQRLRVSGAPFAGTLMGKLLSRFVVGLGQMILLLAIGWAAFGVSLGPNPAALLMPSAAIAFAAASFALVIACIARTHDSVMPVGTIAAMTMSAIGGCWWPLGFEPHWMRAIALWIPTTWTMEAYNDLMIRNLPPASALQGTAATVVLGVIYLIAGVLIASRVYD